MASCELWQAVVLSLGFDPGYFELWNDGAGNHYPLPPQASRVAPQVALHKLLPESDKKAIQGRLMVAASHLGTGFKTKQSGVFLPAISVRTDIDLLDFGSWAEKKWPDLHPKFPRNQSTKGVGGRPRGEQSQLKIDSDARRPEPKTKTLNILFMDLAGWSRLTAPQVELYLILPRIGGRFRYAA
ncbi:MAG TPA: hypothetical protein VNG33_19265 [Polyangiaceae bacterium]|nr:hypothetical protein [Polyangiaceae bacterium]